MADKSPHFGDGNVERWLGNEAIANDPIVAGLKKLGLANPDNTPKFNMSTVL
jgi:hypothetical protein